VIAATDPNDLLSYRLDPAFLGRSNTEKIRIVNVLVSNADTIAGVFQNPLAAHQGYETNQSVIGLISQREK
jgi:hypothetical protein